MKSSYKLFLFVFSFVVAGVNAAEINVCRSEEGNSNETYLGLATTKTRLICEATQPGFRPTLVQLYRNNWRLVEVVDGTVVGTAKGSVYRSPVYYLKRDKLPKGFKKTWYDDEVNFL